MSDELLSLDLSSFKVREIEAFEELSGIPFDEAFGSGKPKGKALRALATISKQRTDPDFTMEQAGELVINLATPDPTEAAG